MTNKNSQANTPRGEGRIRPLEAADRSPIEAMVVSSGKFNEVEIVTAMELVDEAVDRRSKLRLALKIGLASFR
jgi:hypothetical protein